MVKRALKLAIRKDYTLKNAGNDGDAVQPISSTTVPEMSYGEVHGQKAGPLPATFTPELLDGYSFSSWF